MALILLSLIMEAESWWSGISAIWGLLAILLLVSGALIVLLGKRREEVQIIQTKLSDANASLVKTRDIELSDIVKQKERLEAELDDVTAELRTLSGVNIQQMMAFWLVKESIEAENADLKVQIRVLKLRKDGLSVNE